MLFEITSTCKGGGYKYARTDPPHPKRNAKGLYPLHRVIAENCLGRLLLPGEVVHHADHDKTNNDESNLEVVMRGEHSRHHQEQPSVTRFCAWCKKPFEIKEYVLRLRAGRNKTMTVACSRSCGARLGHHGPIFVSEEQSLCGAGGDASQGS